MSMCDGEAQINTGGAFESPMQRRGRMHREIGNGAVVSEPAP